MPGTTGHLTFYVKGKASWCSHDCPNALHYRLPSNGVLVESRVRTTPKGPSTGGSAMSGDTKRTLVFTRASDMRMKGPSVTIEGNGTAADNA